MAVYTFASASFALDELTDSEKQTLATEIEQCLETQTSNEESTDTCHGIYVDECLSNSDNFTTSAMSRCAYNAMDAWDVLLNRYYQDSLAHVETINEIEGYGNPVEIFKDAQRSWLEFRTKECDASRLPAYGGTVASNLGAGCYLDMTIERTIHYYNWHI